jgi:hypothetical protein
VIPSDTYPSLPNNSATALVLFLVLSSSNPMYTWLSRHHVSSPPFYSVFHKLV